MRKILVQKGLLSIDNKRTTPQNSNSEIFLEFSFFVGSISSSSITINRSLVHPGIHGQTSPFWFKIFKNLLVLIRPENWIFWSWSGLIGFGP